MSTEPQGSSVVADMAADREAQTKRGMTIQEAIEGALWLRRTPDGHMDTAKLRVLALTLLSALEASTCYFKAMQKGEEVFVLRQQDRAAPLAIDTWANAAEIKGCGHAKVADARAIAARWLKQDLDTTKWPT